MARTYTVVRDGEWIQPTVRGHRMACCDCGLVHAVTFRVVGGRVQFRAIRDAKETKKFRGRKSHV